MKEKNNKKYTFNAEVANRMCVRAIKICDSDIDKLEQALMRDFSVGDKLEVIVIKKT